jgi:predicted ribosomally synthesized peptide with SipW-like signal peptide
MTINLASARRVLASARTRAALSLGVVLAVGATGTFAYWTDSVAVAGTTFTAGTIDLKVNGSDTPPSYTALSLGNMVPGNTTAGTLVIRNAGTAPMKYSALTTASNTDTKNLRGSLIVKVTGDASTSGTSPAMTCPGAALAGTTTTLNGPLVSAGRLLAPGASETVCVQVTLDPNAPSALQGATTNVTFSFTGTSDLS